MTRLLIADDHPIVRHGLRDVLRVEPDFEVVGEAEDTHTLIDRLRKTAVDVVLLDISMPGRSGLDVLKDIKLEFPGLAVLIVSVHPEEQFAMWALKGGAAGYIHKASPPDELIMAIRKVAQGGRYISPAFAERLALDIQSGGRARAPHEHLSSREFTVLCLLASGKTVKECAAELSLSVKTVSTYRTRILAKLNMKANSDLTRYALQHELLK